MRLDLTNQLSLPQLADECMNMPPPGILERLFQSRPEQRLITLIKEFREEEIKTVLEKFGDRILENVPPDQKKALDYAVNIFSVPEKAIINPERFARDSKLILPGREDLGRLKFISGLTTGGTPWHQMAFHLYDHSGIQTEITSLSGHDGDWFHFRKSNIKNMVEEILDTTQKDTYLCTFSFAGVAASLAELRKPGFCRGHIGIGWAYVLRNQKNEELIDKVARRTCVLAPLRKYFHTEYPRDQSEDNARCPQFTRMPFSLAADLRKGQKMVIRELVKALRNLKSGYNFGPLLYLHGSEDLPIDPIVREIANNYIKSPLKVVPELIPGGRHDSQNGATHNRVFDYIADFLPMLMQFSGIDSRIIPDFKKNKGALKKLRREEPELFKNLRAA